jgi:hypothetical protein
MMPQASEDDTNRRCKVTAPLPADSSATMATILGLRAGSVSDAPPPSIIDEHKFMLAMPTEGDRDFGEGGAGYCPTAGSPLCLPCVRRHWVPYAPRMRRRGGQLTGAMVEATFPGSFAPLGR